ncbi:hypothetical protein PALI_a0752 [Pseudoalteromonas aliena SW19]|uniref:Uncharacterized protein n=1 Tax=Pseudoalteromonas aliena SW19 TaxID=1314866 RepID=A0ABR9DYX1_9GAMM|nr:hypothetical protein [Pseudoalteromonas aliena SW19]
MVLKLIPRLAKKVMPAITNTRACLSFCVEFTAKCLVFRQSSAYGV